MEYSETMVSRLNHGSISPNATQVGGQRSGKQIGGQLGCSNLINAASICHQLYNQTNE